MHPALSEKEKKKRKKERKKKKKKKVLAVIMPALQTGLLSVHTADPSG